MTTERMTDVQWEWARLLLDAIASAGVRDVLVSPGSRSTPFVLAALEHPLLTCRDIHDERSAAFFALGVAKTSGRVPLLLCTSGSAAAHYLPAIIEAAHSYTPLVVLSADRPSELHGCGAPQTIDQTRLFGHHVRHFVDIGAPKRSMVVYRALRRAAFQAVLAARYPIPGPVHVNARTEKPLEPQRGIDSMELDAIMQSSMTLYAPSMHPSAAAVRTLTDACRSSSRGLIVCGPASVGQAESRDAIEQLASSTGFPLLAEATSQLRFGAGSTSVARCDAFDAMLRSDAGRELLDVDLLLQLGGAPTSSAWDSFLMDGKQRHRFVIAAHGFHDPSSSATDIVLGDPGDVARAVVAGLRAHTARLSGERDAWLSKLVPLEEHVWNAIDAELDTVADELTEGGAARAVLAGMPNDSRLFIGNSLPVRHVDRWCRSSTTDIRVVSQRGANGIDGLVSGAAGAAYASRRPTVALLGDVSTLHDVGGLLSAKNLGAPLVTVVLNNDGGRIFEELPLSRDASWNAAISHFTTPHGLTFEHAAAMFGHGYVAPRSVSALRRAVSEACARNTCTIIEAVVRAESAGEQARRMYERVAKVLEKARREQRG